MQMKARHLRMFALEVCREFPDGKPDAWASSQKLRVLTFLETAEMLEALESVVEDLRKSTKREKEYIAQLTKLTANHEQQHQHAWKLIEGTKTAFACALCGQVAHGDGFEKRETYVKSVLDALCKHPAERDLLTPAAYGHFDHGSSIQVAIDNLRLMVEK